MAKFVTTAIKFVQLDYIGKVYNNPINIDLCTEIVKYDEPNGYGKNYPIIIFKGCNTKWYYDNSKLRDRDYDDIIKSNS